MPAFFLKFSAVLFVLFCAEITTWAQELIVAPWTALLARMSAAAAKVFYPETITSGLGMINTSNGFGVLIAPGCNGIEAVIVLASAMVAFPARAIHKAIGLAVALVAVQTANLLRIVSLFALGQWDRSYFEFAHLYAWQALIMFDVLVVWCLWIQYVRTRDA